MPVRDRMRHAECIVNGRKKARLNLAFSGLLLRLIL